MDVSAAPFKPYAHKTTGAFLGWYNTLPADGVEVPPPAHGSQRWDGEAWVGAVPAPLKRDAMRMIDAFEAEGVITAAKATALRTRLGNG